MLLQWWTGAVDYPLVIAGKPLFAVEPSVPIMFELSVLLGGVRRGLRDVRAEQAAARTTTRSSTTHAPHGATNDRFLLAVEADDPKFQAEEVIRLLWTRCGSRHTELVEA